MTLTVEEFLRRFLLHLLPPGFVRIRNFGFLANRQPRHAPAALLPTAQRLREDNCFAGITVHRSDSFTLELPSLRRNHARHRTALRRATPAPLSTTTRPVRCMNLYLHPRPLPVLRRACRSLVSSRQKLPCCQTFQPLPDDSNDARSEAPSRRSKRQILPITASLFSPLHPVCPIQST